MLSDTMVSLEAVARISRAVALEHGRALNVVGVTSTDADAERVELLITIEGCHNEPCRFVVNVNRGERDEFEVALRAKLSQALQAHHSRP